MKDFLPAIKSGLGNKWLVPFILCYGVIMWAFSQTTALIVSYVVLLILILCLADDIKNIFAIILFVPLYIKDIMQELPIVLYGIAIGLAFISFAVFIIRKKAWKGCVEKSGKMGLPLIIATVAFLLGGVIGYFDVINFFITFGLSVAAIILYYFALNYTEDLKKYLAFLFLCGAAAIVVQAFAASVFGINVKDSVGVVWIGTEGLNTVAIYLCLGMIGAFELGKDQTNDWIMFLFATLFLFATFRTICRTMIAITFVAYVFCTVVTIMASKNKLWFLTVIPFAAIFIGGMFLFFKDKTLTFFEALIQKFFYLGKTDGTMHGRIPLWKWCWGKFMESPVFGVGFITAEKVPAIREPAAHFILAHNTVLQWLTSLGIVGTLMMGCFYFVKYKTLITRSPKNNIFVITAVLCVAISGMMDQAATMEFFVWMMPILFVSAVENERVPLKEENLDGNDKELNG